MISSAREGLRGVEGWRGVERAEGLGLKRRFGAGRAGGGRDGCFGVRVSAFRGRKEGETNGVGLAAAAAGEVDLSEEPTFGGLLLRGTASGSGRRRLGGRRGREEADGLARAGSGLAAAKRVSGEQRVEREGALDKHAGVRIVFVLLGSHLSLRSRRVPRCRGLLLLVRRDADAFNDGYGGFVGRIGGRKKLNVGERVVGKGDTSLGSSSAGSGGCKRWELWTGVAATRCQRGQKIREDGALDEQITEPELPVFFVREIVDRKSVV